MEIDIGGGKSRIRQKAIECLQNSDLSVVFETAGMEVADESAGAAMKAVLAERLADCAVKAMKEAKRRNAKVGAATIIIASQQK